MSEILVCPVCGKEYQSKFYYDKHVAAHEVEVPEIDAMIPENEEAPVVQVVDDEGVALLEVVDEKEPAPVFDPEKAKAKAEVALVKLTSFMETFGAPAESSRDKWKDAIGSLQAAIDFL